MVKVNVDKVPDEFKSLVKEEMTYAEVGVLGRVIVHNWVERQKNKYHAWVRRVKGK